MLCFFRRMLKVVKDVIYNKSFYDIMEWNCEYDGEEEKEEKDFFFVFNKCFFVI